ncbi:MAG: alanine--glyoxylate aminotransferase family protein [Dehalococcoidia bacterium]|nr:alanine--glyoxylate aminotransferase family protein [Dehalococcoidia bacterium]
MSQQMINHRGPEFRQLIDGLTDKLSRIYMTSGKVYILTASGTGALEAAVVNTLSPDDKVLAVSIGYFGDRFADIARIYRTNVTKLEFEWGTPADPEVIRKALQDDPGIKAVLVTHNETSTGITNDLESIAKVVKGEFGKLLLVDAVSSLGCVPLNTDQWQCDVVSTASQKGLMVPPGLSFASVSDRGWEAYKESTMPRYYLDLGSAHRYLDRGQNPFTPNVALLYGLDVALDMMLDEGMESVYQRHHEIADFTRAGVQKLGLTLLADDAHASDTVTAINNPEGVDCGALVEMMRTEHSVVLAAGQGPLQGKIFRIGHMGLVTREDIQEVLNALETSLTKLGYQLVPSN